MPDTYLFLGAHPETLDSGRRIARGDQLDKADLEGPIATRLAADGQIVKSRPETANERKARTRAPDSDGGAAIAAPSSDSDEIDSSDDPAASAADTSKETN